MFPPPRPFPALPHRLVKTRSSSRSPLPPPLPYHRAVDRVAAPLLVTPSRLRTSPRAGHRAGGVIVSSSTLATLRSSVQGNRLACGTCALLLLLLPAHGRASWPFQRGAQVNQQATTNHQPPTVGLELAGKDWTTTTSLDLLHLPDLLWSDSDSVLNQDIVTFCIRITPRAHTPPA